MTKYDWMNKKEDEEIILIVRQHPWYFFVPAISILAVFGVLAMIFIFFRSSQVLSWATVVALAMSLYILARAWFVWQSQTYVISNERLVGVEQRGWFTHSVSEATLENILFINHVIKGPIKTMLNFGDVHIRASGVTEDELVFRNVANPYEIQQLVVKAQKTKTGSSKLVEDNQKIVIR